MQTQYIKQVFILFLFSLIFALTVWIVKENKLPDNIQGERIFKSYSDEASTIEFNAPNFTLTLDKIDNLWSIREADSYYANYELIKWLEKYINQGKILKKAQLTSEEEKNIFTQSLTINIYNANQERKDSIKVSLQTKQSNSLIAKINGKRDIYQIETPQAIPLNIRDWLFQPLLNIKTDEIEKITIDNKSATRKQGNNFFQTEQGKIYDIRNIEKTLNYLPFEEVKSAQNFDETQYVQLKHYQITTKTGLIYELSLYGKGQEIWLKQKIKTTTLPTTQTSDYIKRNEFLYNYWYFKLPIQHGSNLINERLE